MTIDDPTSHPLAGRRAIVTGAAQGIGRAIACALADAGVLVAACDRKASIDELGDVLRRSSPGSLAEITDISVPEQAKAFVDRTAEAFGGIDLVINNAGTMEPTHPVTATWEETLAAFDSVAGDNYRGTFLIGRAAIPHLVVGGVGGGGGGGDIVNIVTDHIHTCGYPDVLDHVDAPNCKYADAPRRPVGSAEFDVYDSSKWAIKGLTLVWATALAPYGVRVNSIGMGATDTPMYRRHLGDRPLPSGLMQPEQIAEVLLELLAEGPTGRTSDSIQLWLNHPCTLPPPGKDALPMPRPAPDRLR